MGITVNDKILMFGARPRAALRLLGRPCRRSHHLRSTPLNGACFESNGFATLASLVLDRPRIRSILYGPPVLPL